MNVVFLVLAHQNPTLVKRLAGRLLAEHGTSVFLHYDAKAPDTDISALLESFKRFGARFQIVKRAAVKWGNWTMVQATLNGLEAIETSGMEPDYVYLLSGADYPIKSISSLFDFLERKRGCEFIESYEGDKYQWVAGGFQEERYRYWHFVNWRQSPRLFDLSIALQARLRVHRLPPRGHVIHLGSQWWTLTWASCKKILALSKEKAILRFYKRVWVPDEIFFQTLIRQVTSKEVISGHSLTLYQFTDYGVPLVYCNGHEEYLLQQNFFFARKISPYAEDLRDELDGTVDATAAETVVNEGNIGKRSSTYRNHRLRYRLGLYGKRRIGKVDDDWYGDMEWNINPYVMIWGNGSHSLRIFSQFLSAFGDIRCHGRLFRNDVIEFANDRQRFAGFAASDIALRDFNTRNFLARIVNEDQEKLSCFLLDPEDGGDIAQVVAWDPNGSVIVLQNCALYEWYFGCKAGERNQDATEVYRFLEERAQMEADFVNLLETSKMPFACISTLELLAEEQAFLSQLRNIEKIIPGKPNYRKLQSIVQSLRSGLDLDMMAWAVQIHQTLERRSKRTQGSLINKIKWTHAN